MSRESVRSTTRLSSDCAGRCAARAQRSIKRLDCLYIFRWLFSSALLLFLILALVHFSRNGECVSSDIANLFALNIFQMRFPLHMGAASGELRVRVWLCACALFVCLYKNQFKLNNKICCHWSLNFIAGYCRRFVRNNFVRSRARSESGPTESGR